MLGCGVATRGTDPGLGGAPEHLADAACQAVDERGGAALGGAHGDDVLRGETEVGTGGRDGHHRVEDGPVAVVLQVVGALVAEVVEDVGA